jgi:hypothetical protein
MGSFFVLIEKPYFVGVTLSFDEFLFSTFESSSVRFNCVMLNIGGLAVCSVDRFPLGFLESLVGMSK